MSLCWKFIYIFHEIAGINEFQELLNAQQHNERTIRNVLCNTRCTLQTYLGFLRSADEVSIAHLSRESRHMIYSAVLQLRFYRDIYYLFLYRQIIKHVYRIKRIFYIWIQLYMSSIETELPVFQKKTKSKNF